MITHYINHDFVYETEKLIRIFFPYEKIETIRSFDSFDSDRFIITSAEKNGDYAELFVSVSLNACLLKKGKTINTESFDDYTKKTETERELAVLLYDLLSECTAYRPPWGILTGIRPSKLITSFCDKYGVEEAKRLFQDNYMVTKEKTELAYNVSKAEEVIIKKSVPQSFSLYVSIPFCPSRCSYCSFVSSATEQAKKLMPEYVRLLCEELKFTARKANELNLKLETVYFGGGTPTALSSKQLKDVTSTVRKYFAPEKGIEYTIEAGRPDSITREKLEVIKESGANRISINPQTFNDDVLKIIGRKHNTTQFMSVFNLARELGFDNINCDLIAGLPGDSVESFNQTIRNLINLNPENITVHTLALKRSSRLVEEENHAFKAQNTLKMLEIATNFLTKVGYMPYYMYRQSKCVGNLENVGWAKTGFECEYNIHMMEETHTILSCGAGAVTKLKEPDGPFIERIFNYKYPFEYISSFDEMLKRKERIISFYNERG